MEKPHDVPPQPKPTVQSALEMIKWLYRQPEAQKALAERHEAKAS